ncbi:MULTISPECIES: hypothetical protein [unclassified Moraxella]|uniref:hypothetical protein n=1 Tax=unclassified Moraxella TaxID=2685852 RepID=UPI003AF947F0
MILCTISQFTCIVPYLSPNIIATHQITTDELDFFQLIQTYQQQSTYNENDLVYLIERYERIFPQVNTPRLIALNLIKYHYELPELRFDNSILQQYQATLKKNTNKDIAQDINKPRPLSTPKIAKAQAVANDDHDIDPVLKLASGQFN